MADERLLELLEQGHEQAEQALRELRAKWLIEDEARVHARHLELERHVQGAKDRDAMRVTLGGRSKMAPLVVTHAPPPDVVDAPPRLARSEPDPQPEVFHPPPEFTPPATFVTPERAP